jgi:catechol 2,3-dioxygenase-like lactoylglutathione lyase family enzyme
MIDHLDHLVLTTADEAACLDFYTRVRRTGATRQVSKSENFKKCAEDQGAKPWP